MATVNFLYRSTKDKAPLNIRLLYRVQDLPSKVLDKKTKEHKILPYTDYILGAKTQIIVTRNYWSKQHNLKRVSDVDLINKIAHVNTQLTSIETHILKKFNITDTSEATKDWLKDVVNDYYNPKQEVPKPFNLIGYIDYYIDFKSKKKVFLSFVVSHT